MDCSVPFKLAVVESLAVFQGPFVQKKFNSILITIGKDCSAPFSFGCHRKSGCYSESPLLGGILFVWSYDGWYLHLLIIGCRV